MKSDGRERMALVSANKTRSEFVQKATENCSSFKQKWDVMQFDV